MVSFLRHNAWVGPEDFGSETFNIIGVGATGSHIALFLAKMGVHNFKIWDHDIVESHNLPNQVYDMAHIGMPKVEALKQILQRFNPAIKVETIQRYFTHEEDGADLSGPLVLTVDTMKARKDIFNTFNGSMTIPLVIETRLGFDFGELYVISPMNNDECNKWSSSLKNDDEIPEGPCNLRICTTLVALIASTATHAICSYYAAERAGNTWSFGYRTLFHLSPSLSVYSMQNISNTKVQGDEQCVTSI